MKKKTAQMISNWYLDRDLSGQWGDRLAATAKLNWPRGTIYSRFESGPLKKATPRADQNREPRKDTYFREREGQAVISRPQNKPRSMSGWANLIRVP